MIDEIKRDALERRQSEAEAHPFNAIKLIKQQKRGLFRTEYSGRTFRENLGLARPEVASKVFG